MTYLGDFLNIPALKSIEEQAEEHPEQFETLLHKAARILFDRDLDPVIYTNNKKFSKCKPINDLDLNKKGLHLFRYRFSTIAASHRTKIHQWLQQGHIRVENFLEKEWHETLRDECNQFQTSVNAQAFNNCAIHSKHNPGIQHCFNESSMRQTVFDCIGINNTETNKLYSRNTFVQRVDNKPDDNDEQKDIHSDIFFPAVKWWYFPDAVELGKGPFKFQTSAPRYDSVFWSWLYDQTVDISKGTWPRKKGRGHIEGSLRISDSELDKLNIKVEPITVSANTLIVANVQLFHGRGDTTQPHIRNAIHGSIRVSNPFTI